MTNMSRSSAAIAVLAALLMLLSGLAVVSNHASQSLSPGPSSGPSEKSTQHTNAFDYGQSRLVGSSTSLNQVAGVEKTTPVPAVSTPAYEVASSLVAPALPPRPLGCVSGSGPLYYAGEAYSQYAPQKDGEQAVETTIEIPAGTESSSNFYYVLLSVWDNGGHYDQLGFAMDCGSWAQIYSYTTTSSAFASANGCGSPLDGIYYCQTLGMASISEGTTYTYEISATSGEVDFQIFQWSGQTESQIWSNTIYRPDVSQLEVNFKQTGGDCNIAVCNGYTDYEEVWAMSNPSDLPQYNFYFEGNQYEDESSSWHDVTMWSGFQSASPGLWAQNLINQNSYEGVSIVNTATDVGSSRVPISSTIYTSYSSVDVGESFWIYFDITTLTDLDGVDMEMLFPSYSGTGSCAFSSSGIAAATPVWVPTGTTGIGGAYGYGTYTSTYPYADAYSGRTPSGTSDDFSCEITPTAPGIFDYQLEVNLQQLQPTDPYAGGFGWTHFPVGGASITPCDQYTDFKCEQFSASGTWGASVSVHSDPTVSVTPSGPLAYDPGQAATVLTAAGAYDGPNTATVEWYSSPTANCGSGSIDTGISGTLLTPFTSSVGITFYCAVISDMDGTGYTYTSNVVEVTVAPLEVGSPGSAPPTSTVLAGPTDGTYRTLDVYVDSTTHIAYILGENVAVTTGNTITEVDLVQGIVLRTITTVHFATCFYYQCMWVDDRSGLIWVTYGNAVEAFDIVTGTPSYIIAVGYIPTAMAFDASDNELWVTVGQYNYIAVISLSSDTVVNVIGTASNPVSIAIDSTTNLAFVSFQYQYLNLMEGYSTTTGNLVDYFNMPPNLYDVTGYPFVTVDSTNNLVYVTDIITTYSNGGPIQDSTVYAINENSFLFVKATVPDGSLIAALDPTLDLAFVAGATTEQFDCLGSLSTVYTAPNAFGSTLDGNAVYVDTETNLDVVTTEYGIEIINANVLAGDCPGSQPGGNFGVAYGPIGNPSSGHADANQPVTFQVGVTGGTGVYTYQWLSNLPTNCNDAGSVSGFSCTPSKPGTFVIQVSATDSNGAQGYSPILTYVVNPDPTISIAPIGPLRYDQGHAAATLTGSISYSGVNTNSVEWYSSPTANCGSGPGSGSTDTGISGTTYTPSTGAIGVTFYCAVVSDSGVLGQTFPSNAVEVVVSSNPTVPTPTSSVPSGGMDVGQLVIFSVIPYGGAGTYSYVWSGLPTGCNTANSSVIACIPSGVNVNTTFLVTVAVTDSNNVTVSSSALSFTVDSAPVISGSGHVTVVTTVHTGPYPWGVYVDVDSATHVAYVVDSANNTVTEISLINDTVILTIPIPGGNQARGVWFDNRSNLVWVAASYNSVLALNGSSGALVYNIPVGTPNSETRPNSLAFDPTDDALWVTDFFSSEVSEISLASGTVVATLSTGYGSFPYSIAIDDTTHLAFITDTSSNTVHVLNVVTHQFQTPVSVQTTPYSTLAVDPVGHWVYLTGEATGTVTAFGEFNYTNPNNFITSTAPYGAFGVAIDPTLGLTLVTSVYQSVGQFYCTNSLTPVATTPIALNGSLQIAFDTVLNLAVVDSVGTPTGGLVILDVSGLVGLCPSSSGAIVQGVPQPSRPGYDPDVGQSIVFKASVTGGTGIYSFVWSGLPTGCATQDVLSLTCTPTGAGTFSITMTVTDSNGVSRTSSVLTYVVRTDPTIAVPRATPTSTDVGQAITFFTTTSGGSGGNSYTWSGLPTGCLSTNVLALSCTPSDSGTFQVSVSVVDSNGYSVTSGVLSITTYSDPTVTTPVATPGSGQIEVGQSTTFTTLSSGGSGENIFSWTGLPTGCYSSNTASLGCTPTASGTYSKVQVTVTDSNGYSNTSTPLSFTVDTLLSVAQPTPSTESFGVGQTFTLSTTASGGSGAYAYSWIISNSGLGCTLTNSSTIQCTPTAVGSYTASAKATDTNGYSVTSGALSLMVIDWNYGNLCSVSKGNCQFTGSGHCDPALAYSFNGTRKTLNVVITGSSDCVYLNVSGSHVVVNVQVTGSSMPYLQIIMAGSNDFLNLAVTGSSDSTFVYVFGQSDVYNLTVTGSSLVAKTYFLGFDPGNDSAPAGNLSRTDSYNLKITGSSDTQSIVYVNSVGYSSSVHKVSAPKNIATGSSDFIVYQNMTGVWGGPWDTTSGLPSFIPSTPTGAIPAGDPV